jgi:23S rRNA (uracil1939-C5)-methyltransferase
MHAGGARAGAVDVERCLLGSEAANRALRVAREFLLEDGRQWIGRPGCMPARLAIRVSALDGKILVALWEAREPFPEADRLAQRLATGVPELCGVVRVRTHAGRRGGGRMTPLFGRKWIEERIGGTVFRVPATCFTQVNSDWIEGLTGLVRECAGEAKGAHVVDLYGGVGAYGMALSRAGATAVTVCEADQAAVRCGREAARRNHAAGVRFVHSTVHAFVRDRWPTERPVDIVVANPPRAGMGTDVSRRIAAQPCARVVLIACDPPTLARDLRLFLDGGFRLRRVIPLDVFPQTPHVETVALLTRGADRRRPPQEDSRR